MGEEKGKKREIEMNSEVRGRKADRKIGRKRQRKKGKRGRDDRMKTERGRTGRKGGENHDYKNNSSFFTSN